MIRVGKAGLLVKLNDFVARRLAEFKAKQARARAQFQA
jgi:hypothetical protein